MGGNYDSPDAAERSGGLGARAPAAPSPFSAVPSLGASRPLPDSGGGEDALRAPPDPIESKVFQTSGELPADRSDELERAAEPGRFDAAAVEELRRQSAEPADNWSEANLAASSRAIVLLLEALPKKARASWPSCSLRAPNPVEVLTDRLRRFGNSHGRKLNDARLYLLDYFVWAKEVQYLRVQAGEALSQEEKDAYAEEYFFPITSADAEAARVSFDKAGRPTSFARVDGAHDFLVMLGMSTTEPPLMEPLRPEHRMGPTARHQAAGQARVAPDPAVVVSIYGLASDCPSDRGAFLPFVAASNVVKCALSARGAAMSQGGISWFKPNAAIGSRFSGIPFICLKGMEDEQAPDAAADKLGKVGNELYAPLMDINTGQRPVWASDFMALCLKMGPRICTPDCKQSAANVLKPSAPLEFKMSAGGANGGYAFMSSSKRGTLNAKLLELAVQGHMTASQLKAAKWSGEYAFRHLHAYLAELATWSDRALAILGDWALVSAEPAAKRVGSAKKKPKKSTGKRVYAAEFSAELQCHARATMLSMIHAMVALWFEDGAPGSQLLPERPESRLDDGAGTWRDRAAALFVHEVQWSTLMDYAMDTSLVFVDRFHRYDGGVWAKHFKRESDLGEPPGPSGGAPPSDPPAPVASASGKSSLPALGAPGDGESGPAQPPAAKRVKRGGKGPAAPSDEAAPAAGLLALGYAVLKEGSPPPPPAGTSSASSSRGLTIQTGSPFEAGAMYQVGAAGSSGLEALPQPSGGVLLRAAPPPRPVGRCQDSQLIAGRMPRRHSRSPASAGSAAP